MVDAQTVGVLVTAASVTVAAIYYVMNLRISQRNQELSLKTQELALKSQQQNLETRRVGLFDSIITRTYEESFQRNYFELMSYQWSDYEDFDRKYGSETNPDSAAKRYLLWQNLNAVGSMLKKGILEAEDCYDAGMNGYAIFTWAKYRPIVEETRRRYFNQDYLKNFEFLSDEMIRLMKERDPSYSVPAKLDKYDSDK